MINKLRIVFNEPKRLIAWVWSKVGHVFGDATYLKVRFRLIMGKKLDLKNPQTFSEKLQWLKLYDRRPEYTTMVDKYAVKDYVAGIIGKEYIIPTLGVWDRPEDIEWDKLPNRFVLKTTHGGGSEGVVICKDKQTFDREKAIKTLKSNMHNDWRIQMEWPYKNVPHRIIAEEFIDPSPETKDLSDYKFFCFDGVVKGLFVATERHKEGEDVKFDFFDADFNHLPFKQGHDNAQPCPPKPHNFDLMKQVAARLSKGYPHVRVDLYDTGDRVLFGEITMYHFGGMVPFRPEEWDKLFGDMLTIPGEKLGGVIIRQLETNEIIIEPPDLLDYKFFCFNGEPQLCQVISGRNETMCIDFFDHEWNHQKFHEPKNYPFAPIEPQRPKYFEKMWGLARQLAQGKPFSRIDFYQVQDNVYFGEITFFPTGGMGGFSPDIFDSIYGEMIDLGMANKGENKDTKVNK